MKVFSILLPALVIHALIPDQAIYAQSKKASRPNVIIILTDDQGYADAGFQGFPASRQALTPNIDRLAREGIAFSNGYAAFSTCGPSRHSLLTGRSASRYGIEENGFYAPASEIIIPRAIKKSGYATAMFGKWHLGPEDNRTGELSPTGRGFDSAYLTSSQDFFMKKTPHPKSWKSGGLREYGPYVTDAITDEAIAFIQQNKNKPFFAYIAHHAPHSPFCTKEPLMRRIVQHAPEYKAAFERMKTHTSAKGRKAYYNAPDFDFGNFKGTDLDQELLRLTYLSMLLAVDDGVGRILDTLMQEGLRENTLIFYLSDNGGALARPNDLGSVNLPLRGGKGGIFDGGVRVPFVMSWPGTLPQGVTNSKSVISSMDIFSTTVELSGCKLPADRAIDGVNLIPYLTGEKSGNPHEILFFRRKGDGNFAIRSGDHKLDVVTNTAKLIRKGDAASLYPEGGGLYDVQNDLTETKDLSGSMAEKKATMRKQYEELIRGFPVPLDTLPGAKPADEQ